LSDPSRPDAALGRRPANAPTAWHWSVPLGLAVTGVGSLARPAQFLQASAYGREVVGSARSGHVSSHPRGRVLVVLYGPRAGTQRIVRWLTSRGKSRPPRGHIAQFWAIRCRRDHRGWDRIARCGGIAPGRLHIRDRGRRRHGPGNMALESPIPLCRRSAPDSLTDWLLNACGRRKNSGRWGGVVGGRRGPLAAGVLMGDFAFARPGKPSVNFWQISARPLTAKV
jgi:hypothetical protein